MNLRRARWLGLALVAVLALLFALARRQHSRAVMVERGARGEAAIGQGPRLLPATADGVKLALGEIAGQVKDPDGHGIGGARVCASGWRADGPVEPALDEAICTQAGADGRYRLTTLPAARFRVYASAERWRPGRFRGQDEGGVELAAGAHVDGIDVVLRPGGVEVHGIVKDIGGGVVTRGRVAIMGNLASVASADVDSQGRWRAFVDPGSVWVTTRCPGYAEGEKNGVAPGATIEVLLTPESVLIGRVIEAGSAANPRPVPGARVWAGAVEGFDRQTQPAGTDADGRFRIDRLPPGRYKPAATIATARGVATNSVRLGVGQTSDEIVIEAHPAVVVAGQVVADDGQAGCERGGFALNDKKTGAVVEGPLKPHGEVSAQGVLPGTYQMTIQCMDHVSEEKYPPVVVQDRSVTGLRWLVHAGRTISGTVVDGDGRVVADAYVSAEPLKQAPRARRTSQGDLSEPDGRFHLRGLLPGSYRLDVRVEGAASPDPSPEVELLAHEDLQGVRISLARGGRIEGTVVDEEGRPVPGVMIRAAGKTYEGGYTYSRDDGGFAVEGLAPGVYRVQAQKNWSGMRAPGTTADDVQGVSTSVKAGETAQVKLVVQGHEGRITGRVLQGGQPVTDAFVDSEEESDSALAQEGSTRRAVHFEWGRQPALTDAEGRFTLEKLAPGKHTVRAFRRGGGEALAEHVAIDSDVTLVIKPTARLVGRIRTAAGGAPERFTVAVSNAAEGIDRQEAFFRSGGRFTMTDLPAGKLTLRIESQDGTAGRDLELAEGEARTDLDIVLAARALLRGTLIDVQSKAGVPAMVIAAKPTSGQSQFFFGSESGSDPSEITDEAGHFQIENAPVGRVTITAMPQDWRRAEYEMVMVNVTVKASEATDLPPIRMVRKRVPPDQRGGELGFDVKSPIDDEWAAWQPVIALVRKNSPATRAGLKVGQRIVSVDGVDVTGESSYLLYPLIAVASGTTIVLGLSGGANVKVTATDPL